MISRSRSICVLFVHLLPVRLLLLLHELDANA